MGVQSVCILGSTGSIGTQALDVIRQHPDRFRVAALAAHSNSALLFDQVRAFRPALAALVKEPGYIPEDVRFCQWVFGEDAPRAAAEMDEATCVLAAMVGMAGLSPALAALAAKKRLLLANKESLVAGGEIMTSLSQKTGAPILPVDSEHSAIFQCLQGAHPNTPESLILTASGGALRSYTSSQMASATPEQVLAHPTWRMGRKITVDCASMMNKGLEVIEAHHLFQMPADKIRVFLHPQSIVHSMVEFEDGAVLAQLGTPDMRVPIAYALAYPQRLALTGARLALADLASLTFEAPDPQKYPCLFLAIDALKGGGILPAALNGANEVAVEAFLEGRIPFGAIARVVEDVLSGTPSGPASSLEAVMEADRAARREAALRVKVHAFGYN